MECARGVSTCAVYRTPPSPQSAGEGGTIGSFGERQATGLLGAPLPPYKHHGYWGFSSNDSAHPPFVDFLIGRKYEVLANTVQFLTPRGRRREGGKSG